MTENLLYFSQILAFANLYLYRKYPFESNFAITERPPSPRSADILKIILLRAGVLHLIYPYVA